MFDRFATALTRLATGLLCFSSMAGACHAVAASYTELHAFTGGADGASPWTQLTPDAKGNVYAVNAGGGLPCGTFLTGCGVVYKMDSTGTVTSIYEFTGGAAGSTPEVGLTISGGQLFGGAFGGTNGSGVLFSLKSDGSDYTVFHLFSGDDGAEPVGTLRPAGNGGFYGVTQVGGINYNQQMGSGNGVLFFALPDGRFADLHKFTGGADGKVPGTILTDASGNVFGAATEGGKCTFCGAIFKYVPSTKTFSVIYSFQNSTDGGLPRLGGIDSSGTIYGAANGGMYKHGTLFSLSPLSGGGYGFTLLASLKSQVGGDQPVNPPTLTAAGDLVGATGSYIYDYHAGALSTLVTFSTSVPIYDALGQFLVTPAGVIYGTAQDAGIVCTFASGVPNTEPCGDIFRYSAH